VRKLVSLHRQTAADGASGTDVASPAAFHRALDREFQRMERYPGVLSLLLVDVRHDKPTGTGTDADVAARIGGALRRGLREVDLAARLGDGSWALLLPLSDAGAACSAAGRIRRLVRSLVLRQPGPGGGRRALPGLIKCSASVGVATYPAPGVQGRNQLLERARGALELAVGEGGSRIVIHQEGGWIVLQQDEAEGA
jgi:diguanylate cyclase (GGDEF)-like protein